MSHPNEDLVREAFAAFNRGDIDALQKQFWAEDVRWHQPGRSPFSGEFEGAEQVAQNFARFGELMGGTASAELLDAFAGDERGVAVCTLRGERAGKQWAMHVVQVYSFRDGRVSEIRNYIYDLYAADEINS